MDSIYPLLRECLRGTTPPLVVLPANPVEAQRLHHHFVGKPAPGSALIMTTSGTTGTPKGARLSAATLRASIDSTHTALGGPGRWLLAVPAHHIIGMQVLLRSLHTGYPPVTMPIDDGFQLAALPDAITELLEGHHTQPQPQSQPQTQSQPQPQRRHYASLVPNQLDTLYQDLHSSRPDTRRTAEKALHACAQLDAILSGGAPLPQHIDDYLTAAGLTIVRGYGSSEVAGGVLFDGRPGPATQIRVDPTTHRISISGDTLADGYVGMETHPDWTVESSGDNCESDDQSNSRRWYHTHDLGHWTADGRLIIDGRLDEAINSGGIMVIPQPLEKLLLTHPQVKDCAIIGLPHPHFGHRVTAVIVPEDGATPPTLDEICGVLESTFDYYSLPKDLIILPHLPHRSNGKLNRQLLVSLAQQKHSSHPR